MKVIVRLIGGLGNQLFQYAVGKQLSIINNADLFLDISGFETYALHSYGLENFKLEAKTAPKRLIKRAKTESRLHALLFKNEVIKEGNMLFHEHVIRKYNKRILFLDGYWQSEKYFLEIRKEVISDFQVKTQLSEKDESIKGQMDSSSSVSMHVRRGDYVSNATTNQIHGTCDLDYYRRAMGIISDNVAEPKFFIFSDDIDWCKKNLPVPDNSVFVDHNSAERNYADLHLMSSCMHNIIANSSFSWWGAWLNQHAEKVVVAPSTWFTDPERSKQSKDIVPEDWVKI